MSNAMEWEGPIPMWIESIAIDMDDEMPDVVCTPVPSKPQIFLSLTLDLKDVAMASPTKVKTKGNAPSVSPVKSKQTAKPARQARRQVLDPSGRGQRRKDKQRGYEKGYRSRQKTKRAQDEAEWIELEIQVRKLLAKRTSILVPEQSQDEAKVSVHQRYLELLTEERVLREAEVLDSSMLAAEQAAGLWGGATATSRELRAQVNALPSLRSCLTFDFKW
ncbi:hypothetical protein KRP22_011664 [Phytophthora ramorum]|uniref:Uncharacterized protein n=1 Tax=Phytophthora ramorum TaxID=164328 RepID=H3GK64_PHYRM|nr:hypothetical protein KRP23_11270 [Phytophthora ramorum]KAH7498354.1 hypothetical protein KRP22_11498 [Phytophthora ramorum]